VAVAVAVATVVAVAAVVALVLEAPRLVLLILQVLLASLLKIISSRHRLERHQDLEGSPESVRRFTDL